MTDTTIDAAPQATALPQDLWFANTFMRVHAGAAATNGQFALVEQRARRGFSPPVHVHANEDQMFYVVSGSITVRLGEVESTLGAGESAWLPRGVPHTFRVDSDEVRLLEISTPGGFEQFHVEVGAPAGEERIPDPAPLDVAAMAAGSARFGCDIIGPPMD